MTPRPEGQDSRHRPAGGNLGPLPRGSSRWPEPVRTCPRCGGPTVQALRNHSLAAGACDSCGIAFLRAAEHLVPVILGPHQPRSTMLDRMRGKG